MVFKLWKNYNNRRLSLSFFAVLGLVGNDLFDGGVLAQDVKASQLPSGMVSAAWYAGWHEQSVPFDQVDWAKYTQMTYAFAVTTADDSAISLATSDQQILPQFVSAAHSHGVKASLSIGGWTGSRYFSSHVATSSNRTTFVQAITNVVQQYQLDGIDFDWEYPGVQGIGCNVVDPNDTSNFLSFLQELRSSPIGSKLILTAATYVTPFADTTGQPSSDVSQFSKVLDYITIMNYDMKSKPSTGAGPSSPLDDSCAPSAAQYGSATSAVTAWTKSGFPANQIVLGVPAYGHSWTVTPTDALPSSPTVLAAYPSYDPSKEKVGDAWDGTGGVDVCGVSQGPGGIYTYWGLINEGFLQQDGSVGGGIIYRYDNCSQTPYVYNPMSQVMVTYDNPQSFAAKGAFIKNEGLKGFAMWEAGGDYKSDLLGSILNSTIFSVAVPKTNQPLGSSSDPHHSQAHSLTITSIYGVSIYHITTLLLGLFSLHPLR
ncbi:glycoside hydrolase family 18 protein [Pluteus cervinus]|uniref:Glycoside hydrolase family 18 protein n=1 Tax=Pluteus cervinus TaxID=181527 RepID=A0ACD3B8P5_9AGAR|nr:glycoside hydrolase family 18 protein [Pluteus cervinus]